MGVTAKEQLYLKNIKSKCDSSPTSQTTLTRIVYSDEGAELIAWASTV